MHQCTVLGTLSKAGCSTEKANPQLSVVMSSANTLGKVEKNPYSGGWNWTVLQDIKRSSMAARELER